MATAQYRLLYSGVIDLCLSRMKHSFSMDHEYLHSRYNKKEDRPPSVLR